MFRLAAFRAGGVNEINSYEGWDGRRFFVPIPMQWVVQSTRLLHLNAHLIDRCGCTYRCTASLLMCVRPGFVSLAEIAARLAKKEGIPAVYTMRYLVHGLCFSSVNGRYFLGACGKRSCEPAVVPLPKLCYYTIQGYMLLPPRRLEGTIGFSTEKKKHFRFKSVRVARIVPPRVMRGKRDGDEHPDGESMNR